MRRRSTLGDLIALAAALPWWASIGLAAGSLLLLQHLANRPPPDIGLDALRSPMFRTTVVAFASVGQWVLPLVFAVGAVMGVVRRAKARNLVDRFATGDTSKTWREFEALVGAIYQQQGYRVAETPGGPDGGVDLVFTRGDGPFLVQCKHWQTRLVDVKVVRELKGVVAATGAVGGAVVTSGAFTRDAVDFAQQARIDLIDGRRLRALARGLSSEVLNHHLHATDAGRVATQRESYIAPTCPMCGTYMVLRTAKRGPNPGERFWGCPTYPKCRGTRKLN
jgi:restriction system protein